MFSDFVDHLLLVFFLLGALLAFIGAFMANTVKKWHKIKHSKALEYISNGKYTKFSKNLLLDIPHTSCPILLSVVIPCYNEEKRLGNTLKNLTQTLNNFKGTPFSEKNTEFILVDDGSCDRTVNLIKNFIHNQKSPLPIFRLIRLKKNCGKGAAVTTVILSQILIGIFTFNE